MLVEVNQTELNTSSVTKDVARNLGLQISDWENAHPLSNYCPGWFMWQNIWQRQQRLLGGCQDGRNESTQQHLEGKCWAQLSTENILASSPSSLPPATHSLHLQGWLSYTKTTYIQANLHVWGNLAHLREASVLRVETHLANGRPKCIHQVLATAHFAWNEFR